MRLFLLSILGLMLGLKKQGIEMPNLLEKVKELAEVMPHQDITRILSVIPQ